jgi:hypothetical protein
MQKIFKILLVLFMVVTTPVCALSDDLFRSDDRVSVSERINNLDGLKLMNFSLFFS